MPDTTNLKNAMKKKSMEKGNAKRAMQDMIRAQTQPVKAPAAKEAPAGSNLMQRMMQIQATDD